MKNYFLFLLFVSISYSSIASDSLAYSKGRVIISVGYGFTGDEKMRYSEYYYERRNYMETATKPVFGPAFFKAEYALEDYMGLGVTINYTHYDKAVEPYSYVAYPYPTFYMGFKSDCISLMGRINFHMRKLEKPDKFDLYGGFGLGPVIRNFNVYSSDSRGTLTAMQYFPGGSIPTPYNNSFILELSGGVRMYTSKFFGIYLEVGYSTTSIILASGGFVVKI